MAKIEVLKKNQTFLKYVGIFLDQPSNPTENLLTFLFGYYLPFTMFVAFIMSAAFIIKYPSDITPSLMAFQVCVAVIQCGGMFMGVKNRLIETKAVRDELQEIVDNGESIFSAYKYLLCSNGYRFY